MSSSTRSQTTAALTTFSRLQRSALMFKPSSEVGRQLCNSGVYILDLFSLADATGEPLSGGTPSTNDVRSTMKDLMPGPDAILGAEYSNAPLFPIALPRDIAKLYNFGEIPDGLRAVLSLTPLETNNRSIMTHIWFADLLECDIETIKSLISAYHRNRYCPLPFGNARSADKPSPTIDPQLTPQLGAPIREVSPQSAAQTRGPLETNNGNNEAQENYEETPLPNMAKDKTYGNGDDSRKANYVSQHFKDNRFSGDLGRSIELALRDYNVCARQHQLSGTQMDDYFVNILEGPTRTFFFHNANETMSFKDMASLMSKEFNRNGRQVQVHGNLATMRINQIMAEHELHSFSEGFTKLTTIIEEMSPQCLEHFMSEPHKIGYLRNAVLGCSWSKTPISNTITAQYTFNGFVTALRENLQLEEELRNVSKKLTNIRHISNEDTFIQHYGRNLRYVQKYPPRQSSSIRTNRNKFRNPPFRSDRRSFEESRRLNECHRCRDPWTPGNKCAPGSIRNKVRNRMDGGESAVHIVSGFVLAMEGELPEAQGSPHSTEYDDRYGREPRHISSVHITNAESQVELFDSLKSETVDNEAGTVEDAEKELVGNHILAATHSSDPSNGNKHGQDF